MPLIYVDRVKQNATITGTGPVILSGPIASYTQFSNANLGNNSFPYAIVNSLQFEIGIGTFESPGSSGTQYGVLVRNTILSVSAGDSNPVNFNGSSATVFITNPAELAVLSSSTPPVNINKLLKWTGLEYDLIDPVENATLLGPSIGSSIMYYNYTTTNYDADPSFKYLPGAVPELYLNGVLQATAKAFKIKHPVKENKFLIHGCLEGPEYGIYIRGKKKFQGKTFVDLPEYFSKLSENFTVYFSTNSFIPVKYTAIGNKVFFKAMIPFKKIELQYLIVASRNDINFNMEE